MAGEVLYVDRADVPPGGAHVVEVNPGLRIAIFHTESGGTGGRTFEDLRLTQQIAVAKLVVLTSARKNWGRS
jgi:hypothetical protein